MANIPCAGFPPPKGEISEEKRKELTEYAKANAINKKGFPILPEHISKDNKKNKGFSNYKSKPKQKDDAENVIIGIALMGEGMGL